MRASRPVVCVLVDAFRHDYLEPEHAPFLSALAERGGAARMRPILGYSDAIRATVFTGAYPDEHGYWMEYCFRPEGSPFGSLERLAPLDRFRSDFLRRSLKFALSSTVVKARARRLGYDHLSLRHLPFRALGCFDWTLRAPMTVQGALGFPTLFDELDAASVEWSYLDSSKLGRRGVVREAGRLAPGTELTFVYIHPIDMASHMVGLDSPLFWRVVRRTDALVERVVETIASRIGEHDLIVFSDHGMSKVERLVSYPDLWIHEAFPERFCFALDATMVRLWYRDDDPALRAELRERIAAKADGRFLEPEELKTLHLDFGNRLYGDEIFLLEPPAAIFPNFHSMLRPRAMHAYHPDDPDQQGIFIPPRGETCGEVVELVEVNAVCRRLLGLESQTESESAVQPAMVPS
jgi:predicted AlkP superfamily pyrophosphatase or phosphodiesterase